MDNFNLNLLSNQNHNATGEFTDGLYSPVFSHSRITFNKPFLSSKIPRFQNEAKCKTFQMKMSQHLCVILKKSG